MILHGCRLGAVPLRWPLLLAFPSFLFLPPPVRATVWCLASRHRAARNPHLELWRVEWMRLSTLLPYKLRPVWALASGTLRRLLQVGGAKKAHPQRRTWRRMPPIVSLLSSYRYQRASLAQAACSATALKLHSRRTRCPPVKSARVCIKSAPTTRPHSPFFMHLNHLQRTQALKALDIAQGEQSAASILIKVAALLFHCVVLSRISLCGSSTRFSRVTIAPQCHRHTRRTPVHATGEQGTKQGTTPSC